MLRKGSLLCLIGCLTMFGLVACSDDDGDGQCGDGVAQGSEDCDLTDLGGLTCADVVAGSSGTLACTVTCDYNTDGCALCGDGIRNFGEQCDCGTNAAALPSGCTDVNGGTTNPNCSATCQKIAVCGDGTVDQGEQCDCGADVDNLPNGCPDVNGGPNANCDSSCDSIIECSADEGWFDDCDPLTIGDCCPDDWGNEFECQTLNLTTGAEDLCMLPCSSTLDDCYWGTFCETGAPTPICWPEVCSADTSSGWPNNDMNAPCTVSGGGGTGWCWPIFSRDEPDDFQAGYCVENGTLAHGDSCPAYPLSGSARSELTCNQGYCDADEGATTGTCKKFCDWEATYDTIVYGNSPTNPLGACGAGSNCFTWATLDLTTGVRSGDAAYCEDDASVTGGWDTCSLVTGQLLSTPANTCATSSNYTNGVCGWITFVDENQQPQSEGTGSLIGICADGDAAANKALWDTCDDSTGTTDVCPPQSLCIAEDIFADTPSTTPVTRCIPMCDTEHASGAVAHCTALLSSVSSISGTPMCQSYSNIAGGDGPDDTDQTRLGFCGLEM